VGEKGLGIRRLEIDIREKGLGKRDWEIRDLEIKR
jgi:hypothetical protein